LLQKLNPGWAVVALAATVLVAMSITYSSLMRPAINPAINPEQGKLANTFFASEVRGRVESAIQARDLATAESQLNAIFTEGEPLAKDHELRAEIRFFQHRFDEARDDLEKAVELEPTLENQLKLVQCLTFQDQWDLALEKLNGLVKEFPRSNKPLLERCEVNGFMQRYPECQADFRSLLKFSENQYHARNGISIAAASSSDVESQVAVTRELLDLFLASRKPRDILAVGVAYGTCPGLTQADQQKMFDLFQATWNYDEYYHHLIRGMLLYRLERAEDALPFLDKAIVLQKNGGTPLDLCFLGLCKVELGQVEPAKELLVQAKASFDRLHGSLSRPFTELDSQRAETGTPVSWYQVQRYQLCIAELEQQLAQTPGNE
jgi:tetratricopeptide (TPR) repeat protein